MRALRISPVIALLLAGCSPKYASNAACPVRPASSDAAQEVYTPASGKWWDGAVFYEIFVRSFQDSDGDGVGDFAGLASKLDYLNDGDPKTTTDLGVDAVWLMPAFESPSYHGYDTTNYEKINAAYGGDAQFDAFVAAAHKRGIKVMLDLVLNHTGSGHPWFVDSASSPTSAKRDWYVWGATDPGWTQPWSPAQTWHPKNGAFFYGLFWGGMPDLNFKNAEVQAEMKRIAALWLARGADGFRLDAAPYLVENGGGAGQLNQPETHAYWKSFSAHLRSVNPDVALAGEVWREPAEIAPYWGSTSTVPGGDELGMSFDFPLAGAIVSGVRSGEAASIALAIQTSKDTFPAGTTDAPFLTNHDMVRLPSMGASPGALRSAAAVLLTVPGTPFLYYGEELGMRNGRTANDDPAKRAPMAWDGSAKGGFTSGTPWYPLPPGYETANVAAQTSDSQSLLSRYRELIRVRKASPALSHGGVRVLSPTTGGSSILAFVRYHPKDRVLVVHNLGDRARESPAYAVEGTLAPLFVDGEGNAHGQSGAWTVTLPAHGTGIWRICQ